MDIQRVRLRGFIGIKKGSGLDEIEIDFSGMNGLIALSGQTGIGKTTIMENLQPFPQLVSRPQPALKNHVFLPDSIKELDFIFNDVLYQTEVRINADNGNVEGFIRTAGESAGQKHIESLVNGKISEFTKQINDLMGSSNLFFNSAFCAQNSAKISSLRPAALKALFTEFMGERLAKLVNNENGAKAAASFYDIWIPELAGKRQVIQQQVAGHDELKRQEYDLIAELESLRSLSGQLEKDIARLQQEKETLKAKVAENDRLRIEKESLEKQLEAARELHKKSRERIHKLNNEHQGQIGNLDVQIARQRELAQGLEQAKQADKKRIELQASISELDKAIELDQTAISELQKMVDGLSDEKALKQSELDTELKAISNRKQELTNKLNRAMLDKTTAESELNIVENDSRVKGLQAQIDQVKKSATLYEGRGTDLQCDCGQTFPCNSQNCKFIQDVLEAVVKLPGLQEQLESTKAELDAEKAEIKARIKHFQEEIDLKQSLVEQTKFTPLQVNRLQDIIADLDASIDVKKEEIRKLNMVIENKKANKRNAQVQVEKNTSIAGTLPARELAAERQQQLESDLQELVGRHKASLKILEAEAAETAAKVDELFDKFEGLQYDEGLAETLHNVSESIAGKRTESETTGRQIAQAETRFETTAARLQEMESLIAERVTLDAQLDLRAIELSEWQYLREACGKDGLRALEIDLVAPSIAADANTLLERAMGSWAMVDFRTQDESGKEVLEPRVIDGDGDNVLIANRSGGQQVWALKALRLAMTLVSKQKSGTNYQTGYADEDEAGLDNETAIAYTKLYREFMQLGRFKKFLFISHKPGCVSLADHIISLEAGKISY